MDFKGRAFIFDCSVQETDTDWESDEEEESQHALEIEELEEPFNREIENDSVVRFVYRTKSGKKAKIIPVIDTTVSNEDAIQDEQLFGQVDEVLKSTAQLDSTLIVETLSTSNLH